MSPKLPRRSFLATGTAALIAGTALESVGFERSVDKPSIGLGFSLYGMKTLPLAEALAACGKLGYDSVELALMPGYHTDPAKLSPDDRKRLRDLLSEHKILVAALMENLLVLADERQHQANLDRLKAAGQLARDIAPDNPPLIETILGGKPADWDQTRERMAQRLVEWARVAGEQKTVLAIKGHVGNSPHLPEHVAWLVKKVDSPWLKATFDYSHFGLRGLDLASALKTLLPHTVFIHVKDARGEASKFEFLLPGEGDTDYAAYFKLLVEHGYQGSVVVEVSGQISSRPDYDPLRAARRCYESLAPAMSKAGVRVK